MADVIIYSSNICPYCLKAKSFLNDRNIAFTEIEIKPESDNWIKMKDMTGSSSLPQILIKNEAIGGYGDLVDMNARGELSKKLGLPEAAVLPVYDTIIIGGGPAGLSAAIYAARKVLKTLLISKNIGGQVTDTLDIQNYLGFSQVETSELIKKFDEHVEKYGVEKLVGEDVQSLELTGKIKKVMTESGKEYLTRTVIIATGKHPRPLNVPGEKELVGKGIAYCATCDAPLYAGADVAVIGGGNSALEAAIDLDKVANKLYIISLTPLTADRILQEKITGSPKVEVFIKHETKKVIGKSMVEGLLTRSLETGEEKTFNVEGIFIEIGLLPNSDMVIDILETNRQGEIVVDGKSHTGIPGVFACGDVTIIPYKQVIIAAGDGAKAALAANDYLMNQK